jgi:proline racemase
VRDELEIRTTDYHTGGEPFRIVTDGVPEIPGETVRARREFARTDPGIDRIRRLLCHEPRGHADMYGGFLVPPDDGDAHLGVLFWHKDGFSTACGHGTIALGAWAVRTGLVPAASEGPTEVVIDVPSGRVTAIVDVTDGAVATVTFRNVASYVLARDVVVPTSVGELLVDVSYGGAIYASLSARQAGLSVSPDQYRQLIDVGREVKGALESTEFAHHPDDARLSGIYGTILYEELDDAPDGPHQRNVTIFADGQVDRSPCGSGTGARLALMADEGRIQPGQPLLHDSLVGSRFVGRVVELTTAAGRPAVITEIEGIANRTGEHRFVLEPDDPIGLGFVLR